MSACGQRTARHLVADVAALVVLGGTSAACAPVKIPAAPPPPLVANQEPVAALAGPADAQAGVEVSFDGAASIDVDGAIVSYAWTFGDGAPAKQGATAVHRFDAPGDFVVELRVTDDGGKVGRARARIVVAPPADQLPPTCAIAAVVRLAVDAQGDDGAAVDGASVDDGDAVAGGAALRVVVTAADDEALASIALTATGPDGAVVDVAPDAAAGAALDAVETDPDGAVRAAQATFDVVVPDVAGADGARGDLSLAAAATDAYGRACAAPATFAVEVLPTGVDSDGDGLRDAYDAAPDDFNGARATVYALDGWPRDLLLRDKAEDVVEQVRAGVALDAADVVDGYVARAATEDPLWDGAPATRFAVTYQSFLVVPAGADELVVTAEGDGVVVVFVDNAVVASADAEFATDFLRTDRVPATSAPIPTFTETVLVEILVGVDDGPYHHDVAFTFSGPSVAASSGAVFLLP